MTQFKIDVTDGRVLSALDRLQRATADPGPVLAEIGEDLVRISKQAFAESRSPDGTPWAPNTRATQEALLSRGSGQFAPYSNISTRQLKRGRVGTKAGYFRQDGKLGAKGRELLMSKKPLIGETRALSTQIHYNVAAGVLVVGSSMEYAAMQQLGGSKARFPNLWGDIPARPFLPVTPGGDIMAPARAAIERNVGRFLDEALAGQ